MTHVSIDEEKITAFCRKHHIRRLALFGSALHGDSAVDSDLDVLVEFEPDHVPGLAFFAMEAELSELLGHKVDLNTPGFLSPYFRDQVLAEAEVRYAQEG
jgi:predicted nucleotidyltransferase